MNKALDQARLEWVINHRELVHRVYELAASGDATAQSLRASIWERAHLTPRQVSFARAHIRDRLGVTIGDAA